MAADREEEQPRTTRASQTWLQFLFPETRMRIATRRMPRDWFEVFTRIPILERIVIKRFVENLTCEQWLDAPHSDLDGMNPRLAAQEAHGRVLLEALLTRMERDRERTPRQIRKIRRRLGL